MASIDLMERVDVQLLKASMHYITGDYELIILCDGAPPDTSTIAVDMANKTVTIASTMPPA